MQFERVVFKLTEIAHRGLFKQTKQKLRRIDMFVNSFAVECAVRVNVIKGLSQT